jgi:orotidine-5'-phosphate decarboxylase
VHAEPRIIVVLDDLSDKQALSLLEQLKPTECRVKIGKELFTRYGPTLVREIQARGFQIFLDLKYHDIPNTVALACRAAAELGVWMINVHASGGLAMMQAAGAAVAEFGDQRPLLVAVTMLTSLTSTDLDMLGIPESPENWVLRLATLTQKAGLDGIVCSAQEAAVMRKAFPKNFCLVTPGIRLTESKADDQQRIMTPQAAIVAGADYLVIGRPITQAADPASVLERIRLETISKSI